METITTSVTDTDLAKLGTELEIFNGRYRPVPKKTKVKILDTAISAYIKRLESICGCKLTKSESHQVDTKGAALEWRIAPDPSNKTKAFYEPIDSWSIILGFDSNAPECMFYLVVQGEDGEEYQTLQYKIPYTYEESAVRRPRKSSKKTEGRKSKSLRESDGIGIDTKEVAELIGSIIDRYDVFEYNGNVLVIGENALSETWDSIVDHFGEEDDYNGPDRPYWLLDNGNKLALETSDETEWGEGLLIKGITKELSKYVSMEKFREPR